LLPEVEYFQLRLRSEDLWRKSLIGDNPMPFDKSRNRSGILVLLFAIIMIGGLAQASEEGPVWYWLATCDGPAMTLAVRLDNTTIFKSSFPLCRAERNTTPTQGQAIGHIAFSFRPYRAIVWEGYRDENNKTDAGQLIEGNIWEAGADPDFLTLGVSFHDQKNIYMNTLHIAHPAQRDETEIVKGLVVVTYPAERRGK
jgi:hypothetical protein